MFGKVKSGRSCRVFLVKMASFFFPSKQSKAQIVKKNSYSASKNGPSFASFSNYLKAFQT